MSLQNFVDYIGPVVSAAWLNAVDILKFTIFGDATTKAQARTALTLDAPLEIVNGGTGERTLSALTSAIGPYLYPITDEETSALVTPTDYLYPPGNVLRYGADPTGGDSTTAFTDALAANKHVTVPFGNYTIASTLTLADNHVIDFEAAATILAGDDNLTIFASLTHAYYAEVNDARIEGNGKANVIGFDLTNWRHNAILRNPFISNCGDGIICRQLCWDSILENPHIINTTRPITIKDGSNAVLVLHPALDTFTTGITILSGPTYDTASVRVLGGYIQGGTTGISDTGSFGTVIDGTYFETNTANDIDLSTTYRGSIARTQHYAAIGLAAIKARTCQGLTVMDPLMTSGARSTGLFDVDATNTECFAFYEVTTSSLNSPVGTITGMGKIASQVSSTFTPVIKGSAADGVGTYTTQAGKYSRVGNTVNFDIEVAWSAHTGTGNIIIAGLPVSLTPQSFTPRRIAQVIFVDGSFTGPILYTYLNGSTTDLTLMEALVDGTQALIAMDTSAALYISGTYEL